MTELARRPEGALALPDASTVQAVLLSGDISRLAPAEKVAYYNRVCESLGLNPLTKPFEFLTLNGKQVFYALKSCTEQLRQIHGVSVEIISREVVDGCYVVTARATDRSGRTDESLGAVNIEGLKGEARANALMKGETKAKRRVTLSICGLGMLDETEIDSIPTTKGKRQDRVVATPELAPALEASIVAVGKPVEVVDAKTGEVTNKPRVTREQLAKIHVQKKQGGYTDDGWKLMLTNAYGTDTSANLTKDQASHLIEKLDRKLQRAEEALQEVADALAEPAKFTDDEFTDVMERLAAAPDKDSAVFIGRENWKRMTRPQQATVTKAISEWETT